MFRYIGILSLLQVLILAQTNYNASFITPFEYGKMLYENPRGISCAKCHGEDAKGKVIAKFVHKTKKQTYNCKIKTNDITTISYEEFEQTLDPNIEKPKKKFTKEQVCEKLIYGNAMPTYFLTKEELRSIHLYLTTKDSYAQ
ncbi:MAG: c-type cytochrome [Campylobacterales bacterium]|nr:c-type cytochrome [Campylobacterales bacterium]